MNLNSKIYHGLPKSCDIENNDIPVEIHKLARALMRHTFKSSA